jgi:hypothetical protein
MGSIYWGYTPTPLRRLSTAFIQHWAKRLFLTFSPGLYPLEYYVGCSTKSKTPKGSHSKITIIKIFFVRFQRAPNFDLKMWAWLAFRPAMI